MPPRFEILLPSEQSADAVGVVEISVPPGWDGPPLHHHDFDESFYVLEGSSPSSLARRFGLARWVTSCSRHEARFTRWPTSASVPPDTCWSAPPARSPTTSSS